MAKSLASFVTSDCQTLYRDVEMIREWLKKPPEGKTINLKRNGGINMSKHQLNRRH